MAKRSSVSAAKASKLVLGASKKSRGSDWAKRISKAKQARTGAKLSRKGKPVAFPSRLAR